MVDFNKKIVNSNKFRQPALTYIRTGQYCPHPKGTAEYMRFWTEEKERCINGYTADDGDFISGYNYFYLNYCPINRTVNSIVNGEVVSEQLVTFPDFWDYDYYYFNAVNEAHKQGKHLCVLKSRRKGYEQPYSEEVLTPTGFVTMGSLKVGDYVMNPNGQPVRIGDIVEQGVQEVYEVEFQDGRVVRCGANHLWATCRNGKKFYIMPTKEYAKRKLTQGSTGKEHYPYKVPKLNPLHFEERSVTVDPYVLGVLLGDGYICGTQVQFATNDQFVVEELSRRLPDYTIKKDQWAEFKYTILSNKKGYNELNRQLKDLGVKVKSYDKFIPENYKFSSVENRLELVRGLMDTDGSITNGAATFISTSEKLIDDLVFVLRSLGIRVHKSKKIEGKIGVEFSNGYKSDTLPHWELCITTEEDIFKLPRKLEKIRKNRKYNYNGIGIKAIRATGQYEQQRCLCIDNENHLYITKDFIPTHNSYKGAAMLCRNYYLIPNSKSYVYASNKQYLTDDGILTKAWDYLDFIDEHTAWGKKRAVNTQLRKRAAVSMKDEYGNQIEVGYKSEIIGVTLKDNPDVVRGKKANLILFEEAGSFKELGAAWQIARPSVENDGRAFATMIAFGTGGDEDSNFFTLKDMFYKPKGYNCLELDNIWDENVGDTKCGFFIPQYTNMDIRDEQGNRMYMDNDGNTIRHKALEYVLQQRKDVIENATSSVAVDRYVAERCITPAEACLEFNGNIFPKKELQEQLAKIRTNKKLSNHKQIGDLVWESDGSLKWVIKKQGDITHYPLSKEDDPTGSIVIWEHPVKDAPIGLYILGVDPYDHDQSGTNSLGSTFVYKRFQNFENYYDIIVAEYTGRPATAEEYYENLRKLAVYYNGRIMYENERKGLFPYFTAKHCDYLLADQPDIISDIISNSKVQRKKGCHMNKQIKQWGEGLIKDWLNDEKSPGHKNLHDILSEPLLEELIGYNDIGNFDRVMALMQVMIYREQLYNVVVKEKKKTNRERLLFDGPLFTYSSWSYDDNFSQVDDDVYTFN